MEELNEEKNLPQDSKVESQINEADFARIIKRKDAEIGALREAVVFLRNTLVGVYQRNQAENHQLKEHMNDLVGMLNAAKEAAEGGEAAVAGEAPKASEAGSSAFGEGDESDTNHQAKKAKMDVPEESPPDFMNMFTKMIQGMQGADGAPRSDVPERAQGNPSVPSAPPASVDPSVFTPVGRITTLSTPVLSVAALSDSVLVTASDELLRVWVVDEASHGESDGSGRLVASLKGHKDYIRSLHCRGSWLFSGCDDRTIKAWPVATLLNEDEALVSKCTHSASLVGHARYVRCLASCSGIDDETGPYLLSGSDDKTLKVWKFPESDLTSPDVAATMEPVFTLAGHEDYIYAVAVQQSGKFAFSGSDDETIRAWNLHTRQCIASIKQPSIVTTLLLDQHDAHLYSGCGDSSVRIWDVAQLEQSMVDSKETEGSSDSSATLTCTRTLDVNDGFVFSLTVVGATPDHPEDEGLLVCGTDHGVLHAWDRSTWRYYAPMRHVHTRTITAVTSVPSSPGSTQSRKLISAGNDRMVHLWQK